MAQRVRERTMRTESRDSMRRQFYEALPQLSLEGLAMLERLIKAEENRLKQKTRGNHGD